MNSEEDIRAALATIAYPGYSRDIISFGLLKEIVIDGPAVTVHISLATDDPKIPQKILEEAQAALEALPGVENARIEFDIKQPPQAGAAGADALNRSGIPGVKKIIAVASGKGGVGKSTVAANLAIALAESGHATGLCDCDLYGPSIALMMDADERPLGTEDNQIIPLFRHEVKLISMGNLLEDASPVIVRGPMATRYTQQFLRQVEWGDLDYLILDLPPGTGDIQLTIVQTVALTGAIIVTTPQEVALIDARKAASMFAKVNVPILGLIENMSWFECAHGERYPIFGEGGGAREAERLGVPLLGQIPLDIPTREKADHGTPIATLPRGEHPVSDAFHEIAEKIDRGVPAPV